MPQKKNSEPLTTPQESLDALARLREPEFAPDGEPDPYRDAFEGLKDDEYAGAVLIVSGPEWRAPFDLTAEQTRRFLAILSEDSRG